MGSRTSASRYCFLTAALLVGCGEFTLDAIGTRTDPVVYGTDDREEGFSVGDPKLRRLAEDTAVALVREDLVQEDGDAISLAAVTLAETLNLCPGERFADQPAAAECSGVLIAPDLVLTAAHCIDLIDCASMRLVLGYRLESEGVLSPITTEDVYRCRSIVASEHSPATAEERLDYAWIRLDRAVPRARVHNLSVRAPARPLASGDAVIEYGFPNGVPLKVDAGGAITDPRTSSLDFFVSSTDSFFGSSGSPLFDSQRRLVGIQNRGENDYAFTEDGCYTVAQGASDGSGEEATYAFRAVDGLCSVKHPPTYCRQDADAVWLGGGGCSVARDGVPISPPPVAFLPAFVLFARRARRARTDATRPNRRPRARGRGCDGKTSAAAP